MKRSLAFVAVVAAAGLAATSPALAIVNGSPDEGEHANVGILAFYSGAATNETTFVQRCSGTLIAPAVVLTAAHCTEGSVRAEVMFDERIEGPIFDAAANGYVVHHGTFEVYPVWHAGGFPNTGDLAVVHLDAPVGLTPAALPAPGELDGALAMKPKDGDRFTTVGYGGQQIKPTIMNDKVRLQAEQTVNGGGKYGEGGFNVEISGKADGKAGICLGDSGGPLLDGATVLAVTSFLTNANCKTSIGYSYRVDQKAVLDWLGEMVG